MKHIHIAGCGPRTGTTLLAEMMIACFNIDRHSEHEESIYTQPYPAGTVFLTKRPRDVLVAEGLLRRNENLYVVYMLRDPRDMITSKHHNDPERYWVGLGYWKLYASAGCRLEGHPRFILVRYEDLVARPDAIQAGLIRRMPFLKARAPFSRYHELAAPSQAARDALRGVRPVSSASVGSWRRHLPRVAGQIIMHGSVAQDLIRYGYEPDDHWLLDLKGITPDLSESHWPEYPARTALLRRIRGGPIRSSRRSVASMARRFTEAMKKLVPS